MSQYTIAEMPKGKIPTADFRANRTGAEMVKLKEDFDKAMGERQMQMGDGIVSLVRFFMRLGNYGRAVAMGKIPLTPDSLRQAADELETLNRNKASLDA